jgi:hypothetical protein
MFICGWINNAQFTDAFSLNGDAMLAGFHKG